MNCGLTFFLKVRIHSTAFVSFSRYFGVEESNDYYFEPSPNYFPDFNEISLCELPIRWSLVVVFGAFFLASRYWWEKGDNAVSKKKIQCLLLSFCLEFKGGENRVKWNQILCSFCLLDLCGWTSEKKPNWEKEYAMKWTHYVINGRVGKNTDNYKHPIRTENCGIVSAMFWFETRRRDRRVRFGESGDIKQ